MKFMRVILIVGGFMVVSGVPAVSGQEVLTDAFCPVSADEPIDPDIHVEYEGRTVYFCCRKCLRKFLADPEQYVPNSQEIEEEAQAQSAHIESKPHDHDAHQDAAQGELNAIKQLSRYTGKLHPMVVHFPIAFVLLAVVMEWISVVKRSDKYKWAAVWITGCAAITALPVAFSGWTAAEYTKLPVNMLFYVEVHRWLGVSVLIFSIGTWMAGVFRFAGSFRILISITALLVGLTGFFGGSLVYGLDHLSW